MHRTLLSNLCGIPVASPKKPKTSDLYSGDKPHQQCSECSILRRTQHDQANRKKPGSDSWPESHDKSAGTLRAQYSAFTGI